MLSCVFCFFSTPLALIWPKLPNLFLELFQPPLCWLCCSHPPSDGLWAIGDKAKEQFLYSTSFLASHFSGNLSKWLLEPSVACSASSPLCSVSSTHIVLSADSQTCQQHYCLLLPWQIPTNIMASNSPCQLSHSSIVQKCDVVLPGVHVGVSTVILLYGAS